MATLISLDPRFPIPDSMLASDPNHPLQLMKRARELQNQAAADTKYDPVEGFRNPFQGRNDILLVAGIFVFLLMIGMAVGETTRGMYTLVLVLGFGILFLLSKKAFDA